jgi:hypothetical protein
MIRELTPQETAIREFISDLVTLVRAIDGRHHGGSMEQIQAAAERSLRDLLKTIPGNS